MTSPQTHTVSVRVKYGGTEVLVQKIPVWGSCDSFHATTGGVSKIARVVARLAAPGHDVSVRSSVFAGGNDIHVWVHPAIAPLVTPADALATIAVQEALRGFQYGYFDGMDDMYRSTGFLKAVTTEGAPISIGVKFLFVSCERPFREEGYPDNPSLIGLATEQVADRLRRGHFWGGDGSFGSRQWLLDALRKAAGDLESGKPRRMVAEEMARAASYGTSRSEWLVPEPARA